MRNLKATFNRCHQYYSHRRSYIAEILKLDMNFRMAFELVLLGALIFIFIISFCGLLQKIRQTYDRERVLAETLARRRDHRNTQRRSADSFMEIYANPSFTPDTNGSVFPAAPPPYSRYYIEPPPKYEEVVKVHQPNATPEQSPTIEPNRLSDTGPPPYTINITLVAETANRQ